MERKRKKGFVEMLLVLLFMCGDKVVVLWMWGSGQKVVGFNSRLNYGAGEKKFRVTNVLNCECYKEKMYM